MDWGKIRKAARHTSAWFVAGCLLGVLGMLVTFASPQWLFMLCVRWVEWRHPGVDAPDNALLAIECLLGIARVIFAAGIACFVVGLLLARHRHRVNSQSKIQNHKSKISQRSRP